MPKVSKDVFRHLNFKLFAKRPCMPMDMQSLFNIIAFQAIYTYVWRYLTPSTSI